MYRRVIYVLTKTYLQKKWLSFIWCCFECRQTLFLQIPKTGWCLIVFEHQRLLHVCKENWGYPWATTQGAQLALELVPQKINRRQLESLQTLSVTFIPVFHHMSGECKKLRHITKAISILKIIFFTFQGFQYFKTPTVSRTWLSLYLHYWWKKKRKIERKLHQV